MIFMSKKIKEIDPIEGTMRTLEAGVYGNSVRDSDEIYRDEEDKWIVDTCIGFDTYTWETGISQNQGGSWTIVEQYEDRESAKAGHGAWVLKMQENPDRELEDINVWGD